jgi:hypothetical protein
VPIYYSRQLTQSGGRGQVPLIKVVGWSVADHQDLLSVVTKEPAHLWTSHWPNVRERWEYNSKRLPRLLVKEGLTPLLNELGAVCVDNEYYEAVALHLKIELWKSHHPDWDSGVGANQDPSKAMWARNGQKEYFRVKTRYVVRKLIKSDNYIQDPEELVASSDAKTRLLVVAIKTVNGWVENLDLGQRWRVKERVNGQYTDQMDQDPDYDPEDQGTTPQSTAEKLRDLTPEEAAQLVESRPWLKGLVGTA